ncbi:MAG: ribosome recycling factor [Nitrospinota bacterium]|nr:ribosome recycling factor [Nitrospinota bacterium]MDP7386747.1 ribosome recycling factor [Nitrospinota bacterium]HJM44201.1 ribosome recycling factor [Nitrospinota bacterium]
MEEIHQEVKDGMQSTLDSLVKEYAGVRTGRATTALVDGILVDYFGAQAQLKQLATISVPESRLIVIQPWDKSVAPEVEKAIQRSNLGLNPVSDGTVIRIPVPPLTEERRRDLVKVVKKSAEDRRISVRNVRRDGNDLLKQMEKDKEISEDDNRRAQERIQKLTDEFIRKVDEAAAKKEKEVMEE